MSARLDAALAELAVAIREEIAAAAPASMPDRLLSIDSAADLLGIARTALYGELQVGRVRSLKVGRRRLIPSSAIAERVGTAPTPHPHNKAAGVRAPTATADASMLAAVSNGDTADVRPNPTAVRLPRPRRGT